MNNWIATGLVLFVVGVEELVMVPEWLHLQHLGVLTAEWDGTSGVVTESEIGDHCGGVGDWDNVILLLTVDGLLNGVDPIAMRGKSRVISGILLSSDELSSRSCSDRLAKTVCTSLASFIAASLNKMTTSLTQHFVLTLQYQHPRDPNSKMPYFKL